jgi:hypothetical protein
MMAFFTTDLFAVLACSKLAVSCGAFLWQDDPQSVDADLTAASALALRMVMTIAKIYGLRPADWQEGMSIQCGCDNVVTYVIIMSLSCHYHVIIMSLSYIIKIIF